MIKHEKYFVFYVAFCYGMSYNVAVADRLMSDIFYTFLNGIIFEEDS